jgi:hypothetical protein
MLPIGRRGDEGVWRATTDNDARYVYAIALRLSQIRSATIHDFLPLICEYVLWPKIKEEDRHEADGATDVTDLPMIQLRQFRSGGLNALYAISLATGHEGGDVGAPGGGWIARIRRINPMQSRLPMHLSPRCQARTRRRRPGDGKARGIDALDVFEACAAAAAQYVADRKDRSQLAGHERR